MRTFISCFAVCCTLAGATAVCAAPRVTLELMMESGFPITGAQEWSRAIGGVGADDVRIRQAKAGDTGEIVNRGDERNPSFHITGFLRADGLLHLPGTRKKFSTRDVAAIKEYIAALRDGGVEGVAAPKAAFGLTPTQLVDLHTKMGTRVTFSTKGKRPGDVMREMVGRSPVKVQVDNSARPAFAAGGVVAEEMQGMSLGTAMAAVLRPLGLVLVPYKPQGQDTQLGIIDVRRAGESWPVGWPPERSPVKVMPKLYEFLEVEITDFALSDALGAIEKRLESPLIYDHNSMARHGIDPSEIQVSLPEGRFYYKKVIDRLLSQGKLKSELRVDEAGRPFLWISTIKK